MGTVTIRNLDDQVIERVRSRAKAHNRSLEAELREIVTREVQPIDTEGFWRFADAMRERTRGRPQTDSGVLRQEVVDEFEARTDRLAFGDREKP